MMTMTLAEIARAVDGTVFGDPAILVAGISTDSRKTEEGELFVALRGERFDGHDFIPTLRGRCAAVLTEEDAPDFSGVKVKDTLQALGALSAYWKKKVSPLYTVGVTGSVGKTTTKDLIASVLKGKFKTHCTSGNLNNHIGVPITLIRIEEGTEALVCEMGMSDKGEIEYLSGLVRPNVAVITNIGTSHMENLGSREAIAEAKLEILRGMEKGSVLVLDGDEPLLRTQEAKALFEDHRVIYVGFHTENDVYPMDIYKGNDHLSFDVVAGEKEFRVTLPALGDHFIKNALFAAAVGLACGVSEDHIITGLLAYSPTGLRQRIYVKNGIRVIADCYNASPESMQAALKVLEGAEGRKLAVLGDMLELGCLSETAHRKVGSLSTRLGADLLFSYGKVSYHTMLGAVEEGMPKENAFHTLDPKVLSEAILSQLREGDTILFKASRKMKLEEVIALCGLEE
ncbi:MAG: UDP-N-acetylmuramoyl-tripeptide--D-alanyl-D-alanine ligase [Clostridia bacterium]|nr:UDP-N-acetylmuramoyl-tripeptide--D-alanyl-D-alanine ligase [Clostridia bacterium]